MVRCRVSQTEDSLPAVSATIAGLTIPGLRSQVLFFVAFRCTPTLLPESMPHC